MGASQKSAFVHLHVHSSFSFGLATPGVDALARQAAQMDMQALALTDTNGLYGAVRFVKEAHRAGIRPILGVQMLLENTLPLVLLAKDNKGYGNLCRLVTAAHFAADGHDPLCTLDLLSHYAEGLVALYGAGSSADASETVEACLDIFGKQNFYIELTRHNLPSEEKRNRQLVALARSLDVSLVATNNVHFLRQEDYPVYKTLLGTSQAVHHKDVRVLPNDTFYLKSPSEMEELFRDLPEALHATAAIAERCNVDLALGTLRPPAFLATAGKDPDAMLEAACLKALSRLYPSNTQHAEERLRHELNIIREKQFSEYFLLVHDIVLFAIRRGIRHSCRGSAAASLVLYLLGVSQADPLEHDLLFERFLNPERKDIPDIDLDFDSRRRDEVFAYLFDKYGPEHACMVAMVPTFEARSALREVGRAKGMSYDAIKRVVGHFPYVSASHISDAMQVLPELADSRLKEEKFKNLVALAQDFSGLPHYLSVHLGGVVIFDALQDIVPMQRSVKGYPVAQYDKDDIEALGLIKTDLLSLRMLGAIGEAVEAIRIEHPRFHLSTIPRDDEKVFELLRDGKTVGCFQLESPGMRQLLGRLQPEKFSDIVANISLFRPGPMQADMITPYIDRRWGYEEVSYPHPLLEPILKETYGVLIFQEQVLRIARAAAGFSLGQADLFRRAMTSSITDEEFARLEADFMAGACARGVPKETAKGIFVKLAAFASFGFPKAHAVCFAAIAYESAYLKCYYPLAYFLGILNNSPGLYPLCVLANEARRCEVSVNSVDVNRSGASFTAEGRGLRAGLGLVKGVGPAALEKIFKERETGFFSDLDDFVRRVKLPMRSVENLVLSGAFDTLSSHRRHLLALLHGGSEKVETLKDFSFSEKCSAELELTGINFTGHSMQYMRGQLDARRAVPSSRLERYADGAKVTVAGIKVVLHTPPTRSGTRVVFLTLEDEFGLVDVTVFEDVQRRDARVLFGKDVLVVEGYVRRMFPRAVSVVATRISIVT